MSEPSQQARLAQDGQTASGICTSRHLDRALAVAVLMARKEHPGVGSLSELPEQAVWADNDIPGQRTRRGGAVRSIGQRWW